MRCRPNCAGSFPIGLSAPRCRVERRDGRGRSEAVANRPGRVGSAIKGWTRTPRTSRSPPARAGSPAYPGERRGSHLRGVATARRPRAAAPGWETAAPRGGDRGFHLRGRGSGRKGPRRFAARVSDPVPTHPHLARPRSLRGLRVAVHPVPASDRNRSRRAREAEPHASRSSP